MKKVCMFWINSYEIIYGPEGVGILKTDNVR